MEEFTPPNVTSSDLRDAIVLLARAVDSLNLCAQYFNHRLEGQTVFETDAQSIHKLTNDVLKDVERAAQLMRANDG